MATSAGEVEVTLTLDASEFKRMMGESQSKMQDFGGAIDELSSRLARVFSYAAIADFFKNSLQAYADEQLAVAKLTATLGAHGIASVSLVEHLQKQATVIESLTGIEATHIVNTQAMLATYGMQGPVLDKATQAAANFAVRTGSLETATNLLARAYEGNTTMLSRYGIKVDQTLPPAKQFEDLLKKINAQFGPVATAQVHTFSGKITELENAFHHLEKAIGKLLSPAGGGLAGWLKEQVVYMTKIVNFLETISASTHSFTSVLEGAVLALAQTLFMHMLNILGVILDIASHIPIIGKQFAALKPQLDLVKMGIEEMMKAQQKQFLASVSDHKIVLANLKAEEDAVVNTAQDHMNVSAVMTDWIVQQQSVSKDDFLAKLKDEDQGYSTFYDSFITTTQSMWQFAADMSSTFFSGFGDGFAKMIVEGKSFGESMKQVFQQMAEAAISYIMQMIAKLLVLFVLEQATGMGPGVGSGVSMFSGMGLHASGGIIREPSIITGLHTGQQSLVGEAGPEAITPMAMAGAGGGGGGGDGITINISGQFIEGDPSSWQKLINEKIVPAIRRFTMVTPTGPFTRRRGVA